MDVDIDFPMAFEPKKLFSSVIVASMTKCAKGHDIPDLVKHPCGHYFQAIPVDPVTSLAAIPFKEAEELGFFKIDMLPLGLLDGFKNKAEIRRLMNKEPDWTLLEDISNVQKLFHLGKHFDLVNRVKPRSVLEISDCLALIRPGKRNMVEMYLEDRDYFRDHILYVRGEEEEYSYKKSHSIAYAFNVVLQLHLIKQGRL